MAKIHHLLSLFAVLLTRAVRESQAYYETLPPSTLGLNRQKLTHLHFYLHDIVSGKNPTAIKVAEAAVTNTSFTSFGRVTVIDDPLTEEPDLGSRPVGRAQGMYAAASQSELALMMNINFVFIEGEFKGSTLSLLGRNAALSAVREFPIVGGSGLFQFARGFAQARTYSITRVVAVVEYHVYVLHYY